MKLSRGIIALLLFIMIGSYVGGGDIAEVSAGLYCTQLANCTGNAGCTVMGSVSGCTITCEDGTAVTCASKGGGGFLE